MKIRKKSLTLHNLVRIEVKGTKQDLYKEVVPLRRFIVENDFYPTGPIMYTEIKGEKEEENIYQLFIPLNAEVDCSESQVVTYIKEINFQDCLQIRHADEEEELDGDYLLLRDCALQNNLLLEEPFYHVVLDVYGESITDIYAPIKETE